MQRDLAAKYVLGRLLGRGGTAEVFAGKSLGHQGFQRPVAIKRLVAELATDPEFVERLVTEANVLVGMQHGNIVSMLDLARDDDHLFLVMELVDGPTLRELLDHHARWRLPLGVVAYIVQCAATGLEFAHARSIVHADVSPSNLLLSRSGEVRVADFGIARRDGGAGPRAGKWAYMAPEQLRGELLTPRTDVFALGVVLYELITGCQPFDQRAANAPCPDVVSPRSIRPDIPADLEAICMRALAHDPDRRYPRMQQMIDAIVDARMANRWTQGASALAAVIRDVDPAANQPGALATMVTASPLAIATTSMICDHEPSVPVAEPFEAARTVLFHRDGETQLGPPALPPHAAPPHAAPYAPPFEAPSSELLLRPPVTAPNSRRELGHELANVHGGAAIGRAHPMAARSSPVRTVMGFVAGAMIAIAVTFVAQFFLTNSASIEATAEPLPTAVVDPEVVAAVEPSGPLPPAIREAPSIAALEEPLPRQGEPRLYSTAGTVQMSAHPWAWVRVDDGPKSAMNGLRLVLPAGQHTVEVSDDAGFVRTHTITVEAGNVIRIAADLENQTVQITD
ncbi:MAG: serine/threonine-protein kinase [Kofleriaceae bacterium]